MIALRPQDQHVWDPRPLPHETEIEAETKTNYCETETETKKVASRPRWFRDLNIPASIWNARTRCRQNLITVYYSPRHVLLCYQVTSIF